MSTPQAAPRISGMVWEQHPEEAQVSCQQPRSFLFLTVGAQVPSHYHTLSTVIIQILPKHLIA